MATNFWRAVLGMELALAIGVAVSVKQFVPAAGLWVTCGITAAALVAIQYLSGFLVIASSSALARPAGARSRPVDAARAALSEPIYFLLAELSMARGARPRVSGPRAAEHARGPLLLVHGLACNSGVWRWLLPRLRAAGFDPIRVLDLEPIMADVDSLARELERELSGFHHANGGAPVTLIAHSMGGLVCRAVLGRIEPGTVRQLVTIATPHHGAALARVVDRPPIAQMRPDAPWLAALNASQQRGLPVPLITLSSADDNFVKPAASARFGNAPHLELRGLGHFGLLVSRRAADTLLRALRETP